jgi:hypothetical protein
VRSEQIRVTLKRPNREAIKILEILQTIMKKLLLVLLMCARSLSRYFVSMTVLTSDVCIRCLFEELFEMKSTYSFYYSTYAWSAIDFTI